MVGVATAGAAMMSGLPWPAFADDQPADRHLAGRSGRRQRSSSAHVPRTGAYAVQGEDELKGMQLAVEHLNAGDRR